MIIAVKIPVVPNRVTPLLIAQPSTVTAPFLRVVTDDMEPLLKTICGTVMIKANNDSRAPFRGFIFSSSSSA